MSRYSNHTERRKETISVLSMEFSDAVRVLGLEWNDPPDIVRERHRLLALVWHPDRLSSQPNAQRHANEELKRINAAHDLVRETLEEHGWPPEEGDYWNGDPGQQAQGGYEFRCSCGRVASLENKSDALQIVWQSETESATLKRLRTAGSAGAVPMLLSRLDQEGQSDPRQYDSCLACCSCFICGKALRVTEMVEKQTRNYRFSKVGRPLWTSSDFQYAHIHCYIDWQEREFARRAEEERRQRVAEAAVRGQEAEARRRRKAGLCLSCGEKLSLVERMTGKTNHSRCEP